MNCRKVNHLLSAYMDGELPGVEHRQIHEHLARCPDCADEYAGLLRMKRLLAGMRVREPRADLASRIVARAQGAHDAPHIGPAVRWSEQVSVWWKTAAPSPPALALGAGLAAIGVIAVSHVVENREPIHWSNVSASALASQTLAPAETLPAQETDPVHIGDAVSNVGFSQFRSDWPVSNTYAPPDGGPRSRMRWFVIPPQPNASMPR